MTRLQIFVFIQASLIVFEKPIIKSLAIKPKKTRKVTVETYLTLAHGVETYAFDPLFSRAPPRLTACSARYVTDGFVFSADV